MRTETWILDNRQAVRIVEANGPNERGFCISFPIHFELVRFVGQHRRLVSFARVLRMMTFSSFPFRNGQKDQSNFVIDFRHFQSPSSHFLRSTPL